MKIRTQILTILLICGLISCSPENEKLEYAEMIIDKVESFKTKNNYLPKSVSEIGISESEKSLAYYKKETDSTFIVWYGLEIGESNLYLSSTKKWTLKK